MANDIVQQEHISVVQLDYYYRMVNDRKQICREEHRETNKEKNKNNKSTLKMTFCSLLPKHPLFPVNTEDIGTIQEQHNYIQSYIHP